MEEAGLKEIIVKLLNFLGVEASGITAESAVGRLTVAIETEANATLIGHRGETLKALQYVVNMIAKRQGYEGFAELDVGNYRKDQALRIREEAEQIIRKVLTTGRAEVMRPMTAAERRLVHLEAAEHPGIECQSVGEEPSRRIIVRRRAESPGVSA